MALETQQTIMANRVKRLVLYTSKMTEKTIENDFARYMVSDSSFSNERWI